MERGVRERVMSTQPAAAAMPARSKRIFFIKEDSASNRVCCLTVGCRLLLDGRLVSMDRVRFGRALGVGAREAAKAAIKAADAVTAPNPRQATRQTKTATTVVTQKPAPIAERARSTTAGVKRGGRRFGEAVWKPFVKAGGVLWLEVTGVLFALFALVIGTWVFNQRRDFWAAGEAKHRVWFAAAMLAFFVYLTASNFLKAKQKSRA